jgi:hypothetical protein
VIFNGTPATVVSASATQIVTTVPTGATTGPISVTVDGQTATSPTPLVIDDTGEPPVIAQVSPVVSAGGTATVTGANLYPAAGETSVKMAGAEMSLLSSTSDTQLQFMTPSFAVSGHVLVQTPYGVAISTAPVGVLPSSVSASNVVSAGVVTVNVGADIIIGASGQMGVVTFDAPESGLMSLQISGITTSASTINYTVYAPGDSVVQQGSISSTSPSIHLPQLTAGASYLVLIQPNGGGAQMTVGMEEDASLTTGVASTITTSTPWRSERLLYQSTGASGISLEFALSNIAVTGGSGGEVDYSIYSPSGNQVASGKCYASSPSSCRDFVSGAAAGTGWIVLVPVDGGVMSFNATLQPPVTGPLLLPNTPSTFNLGTGQFESFQFIGTAGQSLTMNVSNLSTAPSGQAVYIGTYSPSTGAMTPSNYYNYFNANQSHSVTLPSLPTNGVYTIVVDTPLGVPVGGSLTLVPAVQPLISALRTSGTSESYATSTAGQDVYLNFTANEGDNFELALSNISVTGDSSGQVDVYVYSAGGTQVTSANCYGSNPGSSCRLFLWGLAAGNYSIVAIPADGNVMSFNASLNPPVSGPSLIAAVPIAVNLAAGQYEVLTFNANAGQSVNVTMSGVNTVPTGQPVYVGVYLPGTMMTPYNYYNYMPVAASQTMNLLNLPASGIYTIVVDSPYGLPSSGQLSVN